MRRSVVAAVIGLVSAFVIAALLTLIVKLPLADLGAGEAPLAALVRALLPIAAFALPFAAAAILLSEARRVRGLAYWLFVGALIGLLGFVALAGGAPGTRTAYQNARTLFALAAIGAAGGFIYWWAAGRHAGRVAQALAHVRSGALSDEQGRRYCWRCAIGVLLMSLAPLALLGWYGIYRPDPMLGQKLINRAEADASALLAKSGAAALSLKIAEHVGHVVGEAATPDQRLEAFDTARTALAPLVGLPGVVSYLQNDISVTEAAPSPADNAVSAEDAAKRQAEAEAAARMAAQKVAEATAASKAAMEAGQAAADAAKKKSEEIMRAAEQAAKEKAEADQRAAEQAEAKRKAEAETRAEAEAARVAAEAEAEARQKAEEQARAEAEALAREEAAKDRAVAEAAAEMAEVKRLAEARVKAEAEAAAKRAEEDRARAAAEEQQRAEAEAALKRKAEDEARAAAAAAEKAEAERVARAEAEAARLAAELEAKRQAEQAEQAREAERAAKEQQLEEARRLAEAEAEHKAVEAAHAQQAADEAVKAAEAKAALAGAEPSQQSCATAFSDLFRSQTIRFDAKSATIRRSDKPFLKALTATARTCAGFTLSIDGHSDRRGDDAENQALSLARARAVRNALIARGLAPERLKVAGYGTERPFDPGNSKAAYALNRRVDFGVSPGVAKAAVSPVAGKKVAAAMTSPAGVEISPADCGAEFNRVFLADTIRFRGASARVSPTYAGYLDRLAGVLGACPAFKLAIGGHTDRRGSAAANQALSQSRAANVRAALIDRGISGDRLTATGYAAQRPFDPGSSREALALNRRVDFGVRDIGK